MRQLTEAENAAMEVARADFGSDSIEGKAARFGFRRGWIACLEWQQTRIEKLEAAGRDVYLFLAGCPDDGSDEAFTALKVRLQQALEAATGAQAGEGER